jgi:hypothetical protein
MGEKRTGQRAITKSVREKRKKGRDSVRKREREAEGRALSLIPWR